MKFLLLRISYSMEDFSVSVLFLEPKHLDFCFKVNSPNSTKCLLQQSTPGLPFQQKHLLLLLPMLQNQATPWDKTYEYLHPRYLTILASKNFFQGLSASFCQHEIQGTPKIKMKLPNLQT